MTKINIEQKLEKIQEYWNPVIAGELNNQHIKLAKIKGKFPMHHHENEDEMFLVISGKMFMDFGDRIVEVNEGEFIIVPRKIQHRPIAEIETHIMLFEPASTINTGNLRNEYTIDKIDRDLA